jgi:hypothetical protein
MKYKWHNGVIKLPNRENGRPVKIVGDGSIANVNFADGRLIPVLIIDTSTRPDIVDLVKAQEEQPPGDVKSIWGRVSKSKRFISLILDFERPSHAVVILEFDIIKQGILVESILTVQALYLQPGQPGDKVSSTRSTSSIIAEIPDAGFREVWNKLFQSELEKYFRTNGFNRTMSCEAAKKTISEIRKFAELRMNKS